jgi:RNA-directed DNA polymerase
MAETSSSGNISTRLRRVAELAREMPQQALTTLAHYIDEDFLHEAYRKTRKDGASGIDGQTAEAYEANLGANLKALLARFKSGRYRAPAVRRVHIPKGEGTKTRAIGIPTFEDKVRQRAVAMVLEAIYEQRFHDGSYGFRPGRSAHQALETLWKRLMEIGGGIVVDVDIQAFLEASSHYPRSDEEWSNRVGRVSGTLIRKPFLRPRHTCRASSSPRFTRCNTVWRVTPRRRVASSIGT